MKKRAVYQNGKVVGFIELQASQAELFNSFAGMTVYFGEDSYLNPEEKVEALEMMANELSDELKDIINETEGVKDDSEVSEELDEMYYDREMKLQAIQREIGNLREVFNLPEKNVEGYLRKVLFTHGMSNDRMLIITDAPRQAIEDWICYYLSEIENGDNSYFESLEEKYYVKVLFDSEEEYENEIVDVIGYDEAYDMNGYYCEESSKDTNVMSEEKTGDISVKKLR